MRVIAFVNHEGGANKVAASFNLPAALARAGYSILHIDPNSWVRTCRWLGVCDSRAYRPKFQGSSIFVRAIFPGVTQLYKFINYALHDIGSTHRLIRLTGVDTTPFLRLALSIRNIICSSETTSVQNPLLQHVRQFILYSKCRVKISSSHNDSSARPKVASSILLLQKKNQLPKAELCGSHP